MIDTAGNEIEVLPDICPYCLTDTDGGHKLGCPYFNMVTVYYPETDVSEAEIGTHLIVKEKK